MLQIRLCSIAAAVALAFAGLAQAQTPSATPEGKPRTERSTSADTDKPRTAANRKVKNAEEDRIEADAKAAKAKCDAMDGNAKDICRAEAKGQEKVAKAELHAKAKPSARNTRKVEEAKAEAEYEVAKERCDDQKGDAKNACQKEAKATRDQARAALKKQTAQRESRTERRAATGGSTRSDPNSKPVK